MINRLTALDHARVLLGPTGYAEYWWRGSGEPPLCLVGTIVGLVFEPLVTSDTFVEALALVRPMVPQRKWDQSVRRT